MDIVYERSARQRAISSIASATCWRTPSPSTRPPSSPRRPLPSRSPPRGCNRQTADANVWAKLERELYEAQEPRVLPDTDAWRAHQDALAHAWEGRWVDVRGVRAVRRDGTPSAPASKARTSTPGPRPRRVQHRRAVRPRRTIRPRSRRRRWSLRQRAILKAALKEAQDDAAVPGLHPLLAAAVGLPSAAVVENHKRWADNTELAMTTGMDAQAHEQAGRYGEAAEAWDACADLWANRPPRRPLPGRAASFRARKAGREEIPRRRARQRRLLRRGRGRRDRPRRRRRENARRWNGN